MKFCLTFIILYTFIFSQKLIAQKKGCTDVQALNYDNTAIVNDGSCTYTATNYTPAVVCNKLSDTLIESSGLLYYNNWFWTHNDSGNDPEIYAFDSLTGKIIHRTIIRNYGNTDWEDITQDSLHIYIGELGNNDGNRNDLKILIINKSDLKLNQKTDTVSANAILFNYTDQVNFTKNNQNHNFDMEAMCVWHDSIHLFSKNWVDEKTKHYVMPKTVGNYTLSPLETIAVGGQITGACTNKTEDKIVLTGYNKTNGSCFIYLLWSYKNNLCFNGNKRKIALGNALIFGQNESITFKDKQVYLTTEKKYTNSALFRLEIGQWFTPKKDTNKINVYYLKKLDAKVYQENNFLTINSNGLKSISLYNSLGLKILENTNPQIQTKIYIDNLPKGLYLLYLNTYWQKILIE